MPISEHPIAEKLEAARRELLDLSLRNPLLNYRSLKSRGVDVVNEVPAEIYRLLVKEGKALSFLPIDSKTALTLIEAEKEAAELPEDPAAFVPTPAQTDNKLQTKETITKLQSRLLDTYHSARMFVEEQGVSILYLALGTLTWFESESSAEGRQAPLILVPVELERTTAREQFQLRYTGGEIGSNLSLISRMKADFGLRIPELPDAEELDVVTYFDEVWRQVLGRPGWVINSRAVALGFFSFGKFMMYNDLDTATWGEAVKPENHPVLQALLLPTGFREPASHIPDEAHLDAYLPPADTRQVVDADSSQTLAILDVNQGRNLVIQGPPGTGKSQTITNLIAEAIGQGKRVLFVAEKMAALEVVKRRLDKVGLGEACLELHSHKTNKKELLKELQRTLDLGKPQLPASDSEINLLTQVRNRLNDYAEAINSPLGENNQTMYGVYGQLIQQREKYAAVTLPRLALPSLLAWTADQFKVREALVGELQARLQQVGPPRKLLFWGSGRRSLLPTEQSLLPGLVGSGLSALRQLKEASATLASVMALPQPSSRPAAQELLALARRLRQSPDYRGISLNHSGWEQNATDLERLLAAGQKWEAIHAQYETQLLPEAWSQSLMPIRQDLLQYGEKWWRFLSGAYRRSKKQLAGFTRTGLPADNAAQLALVDAVLEAQRQEQIIRQHENLGSQLFGSRWRGYDSSWKDLATLKTWVQDLRRDLASGTLPAGVLPYLNGEPDLLTLEAPTRELEKTLADFEIAAAALTGMLVWEKINPAEPAPGLENQAFGYLQEKWQHWQMQPEELHRVVTWNILADRLQEEGLQEVVNLALEWPESGQYLVAAFEQTWLEALLEKAYESQPALRHFERSGHEDAIQKFKSLDMLLLAYNRARLATRHWEALPLHEAGGQLGVLRREFEKKARHLPIRQLMDRAGQAIQAIKPVFMMGPLSIANFLPPAAVQFDLVIFDEASQVKPVEAFGAILRAKQVVVVGDSKQMPPTSFFDALVKEEEVEEEDNIAAEVESVLGLFSAQGAPQRMLRWHYRSRHESLVAVSNQEFYDNRLVIFPSPDAERKETGLLYRHLPDTFYDRGKSRTNPKEAEAVALAIMAHARETPTLTLGVAAFSMAQMQAIINQLELLRRQDPMAETFFNAHVNEPFFIKNLENVQGDERDVIFISIGYGRTEDGFLSMSFGPLNGMGGERRLNVLITRARLRCEVFTNLSADDIDLGRTQARGVQAFKTFLSYAQNGQLPKAPDAGGEVDSPFEESVCRALQQAGYQVKTQVGSAGFFIDLAVVDPAQPGRYLLGIECDGANYHRARSARDRDRLRQSVLEGLGWQIYRLWSTDWFRNPEAEKERLLAAVKAAAEKSDQVPSKPVSAQTAAPVILREKEQAAPAQPTALPAYRMADLQIKTGGRELQELPVATLAEWLAEVVRVESPVHREEVVSRLTQAAAVPRIGPRLRTALEAALALAVEAGEIVPRKDLLWAKDMQVPPLRDRSALPADARNIAFIAPEELALAVERVVRASFGIAQADLPGAVARLLGFARLNEDIREQVEITAEELVREGKLQVREGQYFTLG